MLTNSLTLQKEEEAEEAGGAEDGPQKQAGASYDAVVAQLRLLKERMQRLLEDAGVSCDVVKCATAFS